MLTTIKRLKRTPEVLGGLRRVAHSLGTDFTYGTRTKPVAQPSWARRLAGILLRWLVLGVGLVVLIPVLLPPTSWLLARRANQSNKRIARIIRLAEQMWTEKSPQAALKFISELLTCALEPGIAALEVDGFGKVNRPLLATRLAPLVFSWNCTLGQHTDALELAEKMLNLLTGRGSARWVVSKAECLVSLGRGTEARAWLIRNREYDEDEIITDYLHGLR